MKFSNEDVVILDETNIHRYQAELMKIARDVIGVFESNNINYSLSGGSILGAIRHRGFIPWDDDIDINIPRKDYNKLLSIFDQQLGEKYYIQTPQNTPELGLTISQVREKGTVARRKYDWNLARCGISIDLYVVENVSDNAVVHVMQKNFSLLTAFAISSIRFVNNAALPSDIKLLEARKLNYSKSKVILGKMFGIVKLPIWIRWNNFWNSLCKNNDTRLVAIPTGRRHFNGETYERSKMCVYKKVPFETEQFNVPVWAEGWLKMFYGDYMVIPSEGHRERHLFLELKYHE